MIKDWRNHRASTWEEEPRRSLLVPNWEGDLIRYYWGQPAPHLATHGRLYTGWSRMCDKLHEHVRTLNPDLGIHISSMTLVDHAAPGTPQAVDKRLRRLLEVGTRQDAVSPVYVAASAAGAGIWVARR